MNTQSSSPFLRIFGVGGAGINNVSALHDSQDIELFDHVAISYVDSSDANKNEMTTEENTFHFVRPGEFDKSGQPAKLSGGGKDRKTLARLISPQIPEVLKKHPPGKFNIIVHSGSGATGPTAGPLLAMELMRRGHDVIVIMMGSSASYAEINNTTLTMEAYSSFVNDVDRPVVMYYRETTPNYPEFKVDADVRSALFTLGMVFSPDNHRVDSTDLSNVLNYHRVSKFRKELVQIDVFNEKLELPEYVLPITQAILIDPEEESTLGARHDEILVQCSADGVLNEKFASRIRSSMNKSATAKSLRALVFTGSLPAIHQRLQSERSRFLKDLEARERATTSIQATAAPSDTGLMFD